MEMVFVWATLVDWNSLQRLCLDYGSDRLDDSLLIPEEGMTFETYGDDDVSPYSSFDVIGWEIVDVKKNMYLL